MLKMIRSRAVVPSLTTVGANGQGIGLVSLSELTTITTGATTTTTIQIPANVIVMGVSVYVTVIIPTAATFTVTGTSSATAFQTGTSVAVAAGTSDVGTKSCPYLNTAAQTITFTPNATPNAATGRVRTVINYLSVVAPTS